MDSAGGGEVDMDVFVRFFVGTRGDMMPGVGICKALEARGHEVPFQSWTFRYIHLSFTVDTFSTLLEPRAVRIFQFGSRGPQAICQVVKPEFFAGSDGCLPWG